MWYYSYGVIARIKIIPIERRSYKKFIKELPLGATFYLNTINASVAIIDYTRELIQAGIIEPDTSLLTQCVIPQAQDLFKSGTSIFPQMWYTKRKEIA